MVTPENAPLREIPALLTTTSIRPKVSTVVETMALTAAPSVTSQGATSADAPTRPAVSVNADSRRPTSVRRYPSAASRTAVARPMPDPAPVTRATGPRSLRCRTLLRCTMSPPIPCPASEVEHQAWRAGARDADHHAVPRGSLLLVQH